MGQIIDFQQRRRASGQAPAVVAASPAVVPTSYAWLGSSLNAAEMWRPLIASCAAIWLAPFGLEVHPATARHNPALRERATRS